MFVESFLLIWCGETPPELLKVFCKPCIALYTTVIGVSDSKLVTLNQYYVVLKSIKLNNGRWRKRRRDDSTYRGERVPGARTQFNWIMSVIMKLSADRTDEYLLNGVQQCDLVWGLASVRQNHALLYSLPYTLYRTASCFTRSAVKLYTTQPCAHRHWRHSSTWNNKLVTTIT